MAASKQTSDRSIDAESIEMLEAEVKKGRPRKFFMVYKGAQIKTLEVFRKGPFKSRVVQAKKNGYVGEVVYGIVVGSGKDLTFHLAGNGEVAEAMKVDAFIEKAPIKDAKFKEYLKKNELIFIPAFTVVTELANVPTMEGLAGEADAEQIAEESEPAATASPNELATSFKQKLTELLPRIKGAAGTPAGETAKQKATEAGAAAKENHYDLAINLLGEAEQALAGERVEATSGAQEKLTKALGSLTPLMKKALAAEPARKGEILQPAADIKGLIAASDHTTAASKLKEYQIFLKSFTGEAAAATQDLLPVWRDAKDSVDQQLEQFRGALLKTGDPYLTKIAQGGIETFVAGPGKEFVTLQTKLLDLKNATGEAQSKAAQKLLSAVESYRQFIAGNPFVKVCDTNRICGPLNVESTLTAALDELARSATTLAA